MSADNWTFCPKCKQTSDERQKKAIEKAKAKYGKVPEQEYRYLVATEENAIRLEETFREDYEQGMSECGQYAVSYRGRCTVCHFEFSYKFEKQVIE